MLVCGLIIFELAVVIFLIVRYAKSIFIDMAAIVGVLQALDSDINRGFGIVGTYQDQTNRKLDDLKTDIDGKFGPDLIKKLNEIMKLGEAPRNLMVKNGKLVKINREY